MVVYLGTKPVGVNLIKYIEKETGGWQPDPLWPDIKKITDEAPEKQGYAKFGLLCYGFSDSFSATIGTLFSEIITSDGATYTSGSITHTWDKAKDIIDSNGLPVRYIIVYAQITRIYSNGFSYDDFPDVVFAYLKGTFDNGNFGFFSDQKFLQHVEINGSLTLNTTSGIFVGCSSLKEVPNGITFAKGSSTIQSVTFPFSGTKITKFPDGFIPVDGVSVSSGFSAWPFLPEIEILPEFFFHLNYTSLDYMGDGEETFASLIKIPDGLDFSNVTSFGYYSWRNLPNLIYAGTVNMSSNTSSFAASRTPFNVPLLQEIKCTLPSNTNVWFNKSNNISIESFRFMADNAPDVTATPRTLTIGSTNISRCNEADPTIITDLNAKGWTVA